MKTLRRILLALPLAAIAACCLGALSASASAATAEELTRDSNEALQKLYRANPNATEISKRAKAILVFPNIVKGGLIFGGAYGEGVLMKDSAVVNYYNSVSGSWGLQAGLQTYSYAVFLVTDDAVQYLQKSHGWELGVDPNVVMAKEGVGKNLSTSTLRPSAYGFIFDQQGMMAGLSLEGTKITEIKR
ncbi:MAG TPA: YSC84-related protein [Burkholderiaceae bacterium]|nr:YSC84-related protein [Burkholderiaceae bacterium]